MVQKHVHTGIFKDDLHPYICLFSPPLSSGQCHVQDTLSLTVNLPIPSCVFTRSGIFLDLQRVPDLREAGHPPLYLAGDGEPVHRQSGALRRGKLHLRGDQHGHQDPRPGSPHATGAPQRRWDTAMNMLLTCTVTWHWAHFFEFSNSSNAFNLLPRFFYKLKKIYPISKVRTTYIFMKTLVEM